ncbi:DUF3800 domain-containing protein [Rhizobium sp. P32RR-XVIII]|uniref:DUF3800 domain-containing protein n=1 Tax=Rhizobium sp. P32RR-XVIII TaxID=2726738 RepID=UPI0014572504|nr:DUF3800 domain-containing protein [Rhizobium sp. P32RR-XVIII]NLS03279.1 DUF3800 domain-containing protein [Rhizobium sp. P32RR-XVIII]
MPQRFVAYVDEAGDEGFGKLAGKGPTAQSAWFAIGALVVSSEVDGQLPQWRNDIMDQFPKKRSRDLHFRDLKHEQRVQACLMLADKPVGGCVIASNKITLLSHPKKEIFKQKQHLYNYMTRFLLERLTAACRSKAKMESDDAAHLTVVFSRRRGTDYHVMREYLEFMRDGRELMKPVRSIDWSVLEPSDVAVENHSNRAGLQIADVFTSAVWNALEPNTYGFCEPRYGQVLTPRLLKQMGQRLNCGLTLIPPFGKTPLNDEQETFVEYVRRYQEKK